MNQLEGKVGHWEKELNQIKLTLETDEEIEFMTHCSKAALDSIKEQIETCGKSNSYFRSKIFELENSIRTINIINKEAMLSVNNTIKSLDGQLQHGLDTNCDDFNALVVDLKKMQENDSSMQNQLNTHLAEELPELESKQGKFYIQIPRCTMQMHVEYSHWCLISSFVSLQNK